MPQHSPQSSSRWCGPLWWVTALCLCGASWTLPGCGDAAFVTVAPPTKRRVDVAIFPPQGRRDSDSSLVALVNISSSRRNTVNDFSAGEGIGLVGLSTGQGQGCDREEVEGLLALLGESRDTRYPICIDITIASDAELGPRTLVLELTSDQEPLISRAEFVVLEALNTDGAGLISRPPRTSPPVERAQEGLRRSPRRDVHWRDPGHPSRWP